ncbi:molybdopterin molybdotransferase MoeA [Inhella gelatinilytica]|uniref:Molybdopterin molybdenumtransferase n=1 Tax=Inhella gelatinilytica TaxID=2795030 RepID=A0A931J2C0_9BURK|nr:gephyrin-like molybdotransferase Glp [Inhella gelatinilytica]MBH9554198.1 molybdopterin molybdotransferase MoeA [Inhella gelatinilytica]
MIQLNEALTRLLAAVEPVADTEIVLTAHARGRVLAGAQAASISVPSADNSAMDGYAVRLTDAGCERPVLQRVPAGRWPEALPADGVARIFTGASVPAGTQAVVMQEHCATRTDESGQVWVHLPAEIQPQQNIRRAGEDIRLGAEILSAGQRLSAAHLGLAASVGLAHLPVRRPVRVALFSTGDELVMPGDPLPPGAIYNSNRFTLRALLEGLGCEVHDLGIVPDQLQATRDALAHAAQSADLVLTSGGVSVGEEDHLKPALESQGQLDLWQIAIKPGKPFAYGRIHRAGGGHAHFVGLPGNPVSSFVTFLLLARPLLRRLAGEAEVAEPTLTLPAAFAWSRPDPKRSEFLRARLNEQGQVERYGHQGSGVLSSLAWAQGLVCLAPGQAVQPGDAVRFIPLMLNAV